MKKSITTILSSLTLLLFSPFLAYSQEAVVVAGGNTESSEGSISYSVGQVFYITIENEDGTVSQGVQHPFEIFVETSIDEEDQISIFCSAYPNPTTGNLTLKVESFDTSEMIYQLFDFNGRIISNHSLSGTETTIDMTNLPSSTYFLKVLEGSKEIKTFKIVKNK